MNLFEVVKASINTREAAQVYGIDVNDHGMALCPFHNDRHRAYMYRMITTTVLLVENTGCDRSDRQTV